MGQSKKAVLQLVVLLLFCAAGITALDEDVGVWTTIAILVAALVPSYLLRWASRRDDIAPDVLGTLIQPYYERLGFCFGFVPTVVDDQCVLDVFYQNRYARPCKARVLLTHCTFLPKRRENKLSPIAVEIECAGAECGVMHVPWPVSKDYQATLQTFEVGVDVDYPNRRGELLRFREGVSVGGTKPGIGEKPARCQLSLPMGVAEIVPDVSRYVVETIWSPEA